MGKIWSFGLCVYNLSRRIVQMIIQEVVEYQIKQQVRVGGKIDHMETNFSTKSSDEKLRIHKATKLQFEFADKNTLIIQKKNPNRKFLLPIKT